MTAVSVVDSPIGPLQLVASPDGNALAAIHFDGDPTDVNESPLPVLEQAAQELREYFAGERREFSVPLQADGTTFQHRVWDELSRIPYGATVTYGDIASRLGLTGNGARAVGSANGRNPIPIIVPCHRVIGAGGRLTGYAGGLERKRVLLQAEGVICA